MKQFGVVAEVVHHQHVPIQEVVAPSPWGVIIVRDQLLFDPQVCTEG